MASAVLLDLSRLASRLGRGPMTGIDRVEWAWLQHLLGQPEPLWGLVRSAAGYLLLDRAGLNGLCALVTADALPAARDLSSRWFWRGDPRRARAETAVRALAWARIWRPGLARMLGRLGPGFGYLNLGHSNLSQGTLGQIRAAGGRIVILLHDTIPLDHPQLARSDSVAPFRRKLEAISAQADCVVHLAHATRRLSEAQLARVGRVPPGIVAPLGVTLAAPAPLPAGFRPQAPYVVALGTIEPRKNHGLLLDVWQAAAQEGRKLPSLYVVGGRGWADPALFERLSTTPGVQEVAGLGDGALVTLLMGARALLHPSLAEGFGLPPLEAAALSVGIIASDLAVTRELLGDYPVYLNSGDLYSWLETIEALDRAPVAGQGKAGTVRLPEWADHFRAVSALI